MPRGVEVVSVDEPADGLIDDTTPPRPVDPLLAPRLNDQQLGLLRKYGEIRPTVSGQELFREGDRGYDFIVLLSGTVTILDHQARVRRELVTGGPGEFVAELSILTGERLFTTAVVKEAGSILVVPVARLQEALGHDQALADLIVQTAFRRRQWLVQERAGMRIVGSRASADVHRLLEFVARNRLPHVWLDVDANPLAAVVLSHHGLRPADTPIVVMRGGDVLRNPSNAELARAAGFGSFATSDQPYDVVVIGAGPAGLAASVYGASEGLTTAAMDGLGVGGQIGTTSRIENYLGFPVGVSGDEFAERALVQVLRFGATLLVPSKAVALAEHGDDYVMQLESDDRLLARTVIIATGVTYRTLEAVGLDQFKGMGVFYTPLTAQDDLQPGSDVVIVGGGNSAGQAATSLADRGHSVKILIRARTLAASMSQYLIDRIAQDPHVSVLTRSAVRQLDGKTQLEAVVIEDLDTGAHRSLPANALFVLIGAEPHTEWLPPAIQLDSHGFIVTGPGLDASIRRRSRWSRLGRDPYLLETSLPGVFAAGDVRSGSVKRVAAAVGEGSIAVRFASEYLGNR
jgi:thioredoxin reductase (NADPH)